MVRRTLSLLSLAALAIVGVGGCGGGRSTVSTRPARGDTTEVTTGAYGAGSSDSDGDGDNPAKTPHDKDDGPVLAGSHAAGPADRRRIEQLVTGYYAAAAKGDGALLCSLLYSVTAGSIAQDYGKPPGPPALRGGSCAVVMSKLLALRARELAAKQASLRVVGVRVRGGRAVALLRFAGMPERRLTLRREHGMWKVSELFDTIAVP